MTNIVKRTTVRALTGAVAVAFTVAGLSACSPATPASSGPVELQFWHSASGAAAKVIDKAVADFNQANDGKIKVTAVYQGKYEDAMSKLANSVASKNVPDLMQVNDANTMYMIDTKLTLSATDLNAAAAEKYDFKNLQPVIARYYTIDGTVRSMPFQASQPMVYINPDLAKAAGLDTANPPKTTATMFEWATKIKQTTQKSGIVFHLHPWWVEELSASAGVTYCTPDNGTSKTMAEKFVLSDPKQLAQWNTVQKLYQNKVALNVGADGDAAQTSFANGEAGLLMASSATVGNVTKNAKFKPIAIPFPIDEPQGGAVPGGNSVWVLGKDAKGAKEQAAWKFAAYLGSDPVQRDDFVSTGYLPTTKTVAASLKDSAEPIQKMLLEQIANTPDTVAAAGCHSGALQQVRTPLGKVMESTMISGADLPSAFKKVEDDSAGFVADYKKRSGR